MRAGLGIAVWIVASVWASAASAAPLMHIEFAEAITLPADTGRVQFDAYGRRFALTLENNDRLLKAIPVTQKAQLGEARVLRGRVDGVPGSWVRMTRVGNRTEGAIWDGNDIYVIASHGSIAGQLTTPLTATPDQTVVYRLSDTLNGLPPEFCGLGGDAAAADASASALQQYKTVVSELRTHAAAASDSLSISLIADRAFQNLMGADAGDAMISRLNVVDGIFAEQVGVILTPSEVRLVPANADPFTTTNASELLTQLSTYRQNTPSVRSAGLAHLMTGKDLDGNIVGIAFLDSLCDTREGVSLGDSTAGTFLSALVMAHELGHNFGARHDGVTGVCASTPQSFLMAPVINGDSRFSDCSLSSMAASIAIARSACIGTATYADVALVLPNSPFSAQTNGTFSLPISVVSTGDFVTTNVRLAVTFPAYFSMSGATVAGISCTVANNVITCELGDIAVGEERALDLRVSGNSLGSFPVHAVLTANNDRIAGNNAGDVQVGLQSGVDVGVTATASASSVFVTDPVDYTVDVAAVGALASDGGTASINIGGVPIESFNAGPHACTIDQFSNWVLFCQLATIAPGASTRITLRGRPTRAGPANGAVYLNVPNDSNPGDNHASMSVTVSAERDVRTSVSQEELRAVIGTTYELTYTLTTFGRLPSENVRFALQQPPSGVIESVNAGPVTCVTEPESTNCEFGTLDPGDVRTVVVRFHMTSSFPSFMNGSSRWGGGPFNEFSSVTTWVYANVTVDVSANVGNSFGVDEDVIGEAGFTVETKGVDPAQNVTATVELAPPLRLLSISFYYGPAGWTCEILSAQRGRCTGSFPGGSRVPERFATANYRFSSDTAGDHQATVTVNADNDGDSTNDVATMTLPVRPYIDIAITGPNPPRLLVSGQTTTVDATITTGKNPVPGATIVPWASGPSLALDSLTVSGFDCSQTQSSTACALGTLPANSSIAVRAIFRALSGEGSPYAVLNVHPDRDSNTANNHFAVPIFTLGMSDIQLSVAQNSVTATNGSSLQFPRVTVTNGSATARDVTVVIPLPTFVTVSSVSTPYGGICTGTTTLQCTFLAMPPNNDRMVDIYLATAATGEFTSNLTMSAANDSTANNNSASVVVTVSAAVSSSSSSGGGSSSSGGGGSSSGGGGGKGGGGRLEWLALALLGVLAWRRRHDTRRTAKRFTKRGIEHKLMVFEGEKHVIGGRGAERDAAAVAWFRNQTDASSASAACGFRSFAPLMK